VSGVLLIPVMNQVPGQFLIDHREIAELLANPGLVRGGRDIPVEDPPGANLQEEDEVVGLESGRGDGTEVTGPDELTVVAQELNPAQVSTAAPPGSEAMLLQDPRHRASPEASVTELPHLPGQLGVAHARVVSCDPNQQRPRFFRDRRTPGAWSRAESPVSAHDLPVPAHQGCGLDKHQAVQELPGLHPQRTEHEGQFLSSAQTEPFSRSPLGDQKLLVEQ